MRIQQPCKLDVVTVPVDRDNPACIASCMWALLVPAMNLHHLIAYLSHRSSELAVKAEGAATD